MKAKRHQKSGGPANKSRKHLRKEMRKQKKARKNDYFSNRRGSGKYVLNPDKANGNEKSTNEVQSVKTAQPIENQRQKALVKEKQQHEKLKKQMERQRKEQLLKANELEDRNIKRLEKQLHLNKRKSKSTPKSFAVDGLDYLLDMCDSDNMKAAIAAELQFSEINDNFEEDFALMAGRKLKEEEDGDSDSDMAMEDDDLDEDDISVEGTDNESREGSGLSDDSAIADEEIPQVAAKTETKRQIEQDVGTSKRRNRDNTDDQDDREAKDCNNSDDDDSSNFRQQNTDDSDDTNTNEKEKEVWEDIYGRLRSQDGSIIKDNEAKYIPPAIRAKMAAEASEDKQRGEKLNRLRKQLKGLLNRLAESNMHSIASQIENLYMNNSRNDMNDTLTSLVFDSVVAPVLTPERLLLEHVMLVTVLHANVGTEVGAHFLQCVVRKFDELFKAEIPVENKMLDNVVWIIAQLYNYKVFHAQLIYEILAKLSQRFSETDIECILLILKSVGFSLRKDDPLALKNLILGLQKQASSAGADVRDNPRVKFMLDILLAVKNNNMSKIPNYDTSYSEHLKKLLRGLVRKGCYVTTLNISLEDLLKADEYGKWWVVGSAWSGKAIASDANKDDSHKVDGFSQKLLDLARKQRMNTDTRRSIFCIIMSAEDYLDAFEQLLHLGLKNQQEREIIHVILHCCLQEKAFNPYYAVLAQKFCEHDRKFQMTIKCSVWDKLKTLTECSATQLSNLAKLLSHLFLEKGLPISTLKIVQFGELDKITLRFIRQILIGILLSEDEEACQGVFTNVAQSEKLKMFRESLKLFIQHFLLRNLQSEAIPEEQKQLLESRAKTVDKILSVSDKKLKF